MQEIFQDITTQIRELLWPKQYFAWQTLLLLSVFSILMAVALETIEGFEQGDTRTIPVRLLINMSWIFFTSAIWWALAEEDPIKINKFSLSPWITGAVLCLFLFRPWTEFRFRWALSLWPVISTGVMALPKFVNWELKFKPPRSDVQRTLVFTLLVNLMISSWIVFSFRVQDWMSNYPSLLMGDMADSAFLQDFEPERDRPSQGALLLNRTADAIKDDLSGQPWYQTERWLFTLQSQLDDISQRMIPSLDAPEEVIFWQMEVPQNPRSIGDGYFLDLRAVWTGPVSSKGVFFVEKTCKIMPQERVRPTVQTETPDTETDTEKKKPLPTTQVTTVTCSEELPREQWIKKSS